MFDDSVQVRCRRCKGVFREPARRLQNGYSRQCPSCEVVLFFDDHSHGQTIRRAMKAAWQVRAALREPGWSSPAESGCFAASAGPVDAVAKPDARAWRANRLAPGKARAALC